MIVQNRFPFDTDLNPIHGINKHICRFNYGNYKGIVGVARRYLLPHYLMSGWRCSRIVQISNLETSQKHLTLNQWLIDSSSELQRTLAESHYGILLDMVSITSVECFRDIRTPSRCSVAAVWLGSVPVSAMSVPVRRGSQTAQTKSNRSLTYLKWICHSAM